MNTGAFGEGFPYANFHELNMDWIIKIAKDFLDQYTNIQNTITTGLDELDEKAEELQNALDAWYTEHSNDIAQQLANALNDLNDWYTTHQGYLNQYLEDSIIAFGTAADEKAEQTIASIPDDYTSLANEVSDIQLHVNNTEDIISTEYTFGNDIIHVNISPSTGKWTLAGSYDFHYFEKPSNAKLMHIKSNETNGSVYAFLSEEDSHTIGENPSYATGCTRTAIQANTEQYIIIPDDCKYIWITKTTNSGNTEPEYINFNCDFSGIANDVHELNEWKDRVEDYLPYNIFNGVLTSGIISVETGIKNPSSAGLVTDFIDVSAYQTIKYTRIITTASSAAFGMTFYDENQTHIAQTGEGPVLNGENYEYTLSEIDVPTGAKYARFTWSTALPAIFAIYDADQYNNSIVADVENLKKYHPSYTGKKVSILGDSISTFVASSEKVDGKAPEGCITQYPGNPAQYENSDVTSVSRTWWGRVLDYFGMVLGINESWAGSCIGYNPNQTASGKYTADNCLCSATRIGHLGENGTPDIIMVFGGTNDINHHRVSSSSTLRYAVGSLDSEHNPYDFDNFPMITDTYYGSITTMLLRIQHEYPNATILMVLPYFCTYTHTSSGDRATPYDQNEWSKAAIDVCKYLGVEYIDLRSIINMYDVSSLLFDGLHPKSNGMEAIAKAVIHKLNNML